MSSIKSTYIPGVCNINHQEIARRRKAGHIGLAIFSVFLIGMLLSDLATYYRLALFLPAFVSAIGYLQARNKFCVGFAAASQQNAAEGSATASVVTDESAVIADKHKAKRMNLQALLIASIVTVLTLIIPHIRS